MYAPLTRKELYDEESTSQPKTTRGKHQKQTYMEEEDKQKISRREEEGGGRRRKRSKEKGEMKQPTNPNIPPSIESSTFNTTTASNKLGKTEHCVSR